MNKVFFTEEHGVTMTSATQIANFCGEQKSAYMAILENASFVDEYRDIVGTPSGEKKVSAGMGEGTLNSFVILAQKCAELDSLCAWLRESVKNKQAWLDEINSKTVEKIVELPKAPERPIKRTVAIYCKEHNMEVPTQPTLKQISKDDILEEMSIKEYSKYLSSNSSAAVFGKLAHEDGALNNARKEFLTRLASPYEVDDKLIKHYIPTVSDVLVNEIFRTFQATQRSYNAEFNGMKSKILETVDARNRAAEDAYKNEMLSWEKEIKDINDKCIAEYDEAMNVYQEAYEAYSKEYREKILEAQEWKRSELARVSALKIVIPDALQDIFTEMSDALKK